MRKVLSIILVLVWMVMIFNFSNSDSKKSSNMSTRLIENIVLTFTDVKKDTSKMDNIVKKYEIFIRKGAHFFLYFVLAFLVMNALYINGVNKYILIYSSIICILYACTDEFHQLFISGRSAEIKDVLLDSSASLICEYLYYKLIIRWIYEKKNN